jgi:transposase-like protein
VAQVAFAHELNANHVHKWRRQAGGAKLGVTAPEMTTFIRSRWLLRGGTFGPRHLDRTSARCIGRQCDLTLGCVGAMGRRASRLLK